MSAPSPDATGTAFIAKWSKAPPAERANYALFLTELCDVLGVPHPDAAANDPALARQFSRAKESDVAEIVETLCALGRARPGDDYGTFVR